MSRNMLHVSKLAEFKAWLDLNGIEHRPTTADYQVLQVKQGNQWIAIYAREGKQHLSVDKRLDKLVAQYIERRDVAEAVQVMAEVERETNQGSDGPLPWE